MLLPPMGQDVLYTWGAEGGRPLPAENFAAPGSAVPLKSRSGCLCCDTQSAPPGQVWPLEPSLQPPGLTHHKAKL